MMLIAPARQKATAPFLGIGRGARAGDAVTVVYGCCNSVQVAHTMPK